MLICNQEYPSFKQKDITDSWQYIEEAILEAYENPHGRNLWKGVEPAQVEKPDYQIDNAEVKEEE